MLCDARCRNGCCENIFQVLFFSIIYSYKWWFININNNVVVIVKYAKSYFNLNKALFQTGEEIPVNSLA